MKSTWRQADEYKVPRMVYVNKMDTMGADFFRCIKMLHDRLHANGVAIQLPIGQKKDGSPALRSQDSHP